MGPTFDEILAAAKQHHRIATARVLLRQDLLERIRQLEVDMQQAVADDQLSNEPDRAPAIAEQIRAVEAEAEQAKVPFVFRAIGRRPWQDLIRQHGPTKEQVREYRARGVQLDHDPTTFPNAAIAASCIEPFTMTVAQVDQLEAEINHTQFDLLWQACLDANLGGGDVGKSFAAGAILRAKSASASTPAPAASPDPSSSDE